MTNPTTIARSLSEARLGETVPVYHYPCGRRSVVVGKWGHMLAHPSDCPDCRSRAAILAEQDKS